jgi:hypothetical protein
MTRISEYLRAECLDTSEPASFYLPGATGWDDWSARSKRRGQNGAPDDEIPPSDDTDHELETTPAELSGILDHLPED